MQLFTKILAYKKEKEKTKHSIAIYSVKYAMCGLLRHYLGVLVFFNQKNWTYLNKIKNLKY